VVGVPVREDAAARRDLDLADRPDATGLVPRSR
jgi:hypothetical protein